MTTAGAAVFVLAVVVLAMVWWVSYLRSKVAELERDVEAWAALAGELNDQAVKARAEASKARREYTNILWLHTGDMVPLMAQAWRAALKK